MNEIREILQPPKTNVQIIYAGGTISSFATPQGYREGGHFVDLVGRLEEHQQGFTKGFDIGEPQTAYTGLSENIEQADLERMETAIDAAILRNPNSIIMSFGTDFAEQAGKIFQNKYKERLHQKGMKIVIVSANDDLSHPQTDAWDNLTFSFKSAGSGAEPGVYLGFHRRLIPAELTIKEPYNGKEMNFRAIDDPEYVEAVRVKKESDDKQIEALKSVMPQEQETEAVLDYSVSVFRRNHQELLDKLKSNPVKAILLTLYHSGTANANNSEASVSELVKKLREQGIVVFGATENGEPVDLHSYETSVKLREAGVVPLYDMQKDVASTKLRLMKRGLSSQELIKSMLHNVAGEIDEDRIIEEDFQKLIELYQ
jgi:L-asparaginase/Glu-tRNA(Gln) amidotransferase subunit D